MKTRIVLLIIASIWIYANIYWQLQNDLPVTLEGRDLILTGQIVDLPVKVNNTGLRFVFNVTKVQDKNEFINFTGKIRLSWFKKAPLMKAGEWWQIVAKLKARHGSYNPGGFNYETYLFRNGIVATGYVREVKTARRLAPAAIGILSWREFLRQHLTSQLPKNAGTGTVIALSLGDASGIDSSKWAALNRTGINHLINVSGLHLTLIGGLAFWLIKILWQQSISLCLRLPSQQAAAIGSLLLAWCYAILAGLPVPTLRSLGMFAFVQGAIILRRTIRFADSLFIALILVLFFDPLAVLSPGFWLSFGAVAALIYGMSGRLHARGLIWTWCRAQWIVFVWLFPLLAFLFGQVSIISPVINLIMVPLFGVLLPILLLAVFLALVINWFWPLQLLAWLLNHGLIYLEYIASFNWTSWSLPLPPLWVWLLAFPAIFLLTAPRGLPGRFAGIPLMLPLILWRPLSPTLGAFHLTVLDVGQGQSLLIQTLNHTLIYDTGPAFPNGLDTGESIVVPTLQSYGINYVDTVIVSHADNDHAGGLSGLLSHIAVGEIFSGESVKIAATKARQCEVGQNWRWDGVKFSILYPRQPWSAIANNRSCVLQIHGQNGGSLLITGDLNQTAEKSLVTIYNDQIRSTVLIAGHHGSQTSTSQALLNQVQPKLVLISAGYRNKFGFPRRQVIDRILKIGAKIADTASGGALDVWFDADGIMRGPFLYRQTHAYPWTHQPSPIYRDPK